jgi:hypothetical protein
MSKWNARFVVAINLVAALLMLAVAYRITSFSKKFDQLTELTRQILEEVNNVERSSVTWRHQSAEGYVMDVTVEISREQGETDVRFEERFAAAIARRQATHPNNV